MKIVITGGTGQLGRLVMASLQKRKSGEPTVSITTRSPEKAQDLAQQGIEVIFGDYDDKNSLITAFQDADKVLLISGHGPNEDRIRQHRTAISAALMAGVRQVHYTSFAHAEKHSYFEFAKVHAATETFLKRSGLTYTIFRNAFYADLFLEGIEQAFTSGKFFAAAGEGNINSIPREEIAEAIATVLTENRHGNTTYTLTGPETFTYAQAVGWLADAFHKPLRYVDMGLEEVRAFYAQGDPYSFELNGMVSSYQAMQAGEYDFITDDFEKITGRKPMTMKAFFQKAASR